MDNYTLNFIEAMLKSKQSLKDQEDERGSYTYDSLALFGLQFQK